MRAAGVVPAPLGIVGPTTFWLMISRFETDEVICKFFFNESTLAAELVRVYFVARPAKVPFISCSFGLTLGYV